MNGDWRFDTFDSPAQLRDQAARLIARSVREPLSAKQLFDQAERYVDLANKLDGTAATKRHRSR
jgi:hypothetical protein